MQNEYFPAPGGNNSPGTVPNGERVNITSCVVGAAAGLAFGQPAFVRPSGRVDFLPSAGPFTGIVTRDNSLVRLPRPDDRPDTFPVESTAGIVTKGPIWVISMSNVTAGGQAYVTADGKISASPAGNTALPAKFRDTALLGPVLLHVR